MMSVCWCVADVCGGWAMLVSRQSSTVSSSSNLSTVTSTSTNNTATMFILAALNKILADKWVLATYAVIWGNLFVCSGTPRSHTMLSCAPPARPPSRRYRRWLGRTPRQKETTLASPQCCQTFMMQRNWMQTNIFCLSGILSKYFWSQWMIF